MKIPKPNTRAFTVLELMMVVVVIVVLAGMVLAKLSKAKAYAPRIQCVNNLKQIGLSFRIFQQDNGQYPMNLQGASGGTMEYTNGTGAYRHFQALSNELTVPHLVHCPNDKDRTSATNFTTDFNNSHVSYFLGLNASADNETNLLAGDRNISVKGAPARNGLLEITTNQVSSSNNLTVGWTKEMHNECGNVLFADSHVEQLSNARLRDAIRLSGLATNRFLLP
jgi:prepilin-type processing-associated H-X9-DG protein